MEQVEVMASPRTAMKKQVRALRRQGLVPLVVYGNKIAPVNLETGEFDLRRAIVRAGGQLIALKVKGEGKSRMVLVREVQRDRIAERLLHVDFYEVDMTEKVHVDVQLELVGESRLVRSGQANLLHVLNEVEIECLPADIVQFIPVDLSRLAELDDSLYVRDLPVPETVKVLTPGDELVAKLQPIVEEPEEEEEEVAPAVEPGEVEVISRGKAEEEEFEE